VVMQTRGMEKQLFSTELVSREIAQSLPRGYTLRPLQSGDFDRGVLEVLEVLTTVGTISKEKYLGTAPPKSLGTVALLRPGYNSCYFCVCAARTDDRAV
jgi:hypothetical protein